MAKKTWLEFIKGVNTRTDGNHQGNLSANESSHTQLSAERNEDYNKLAEMFKLTGIVYRNSIGK